MKVKVAVVQDSPIFFNKDATLKKANEIVGSAASQNCNLIVFPESFIPGYPRGFNFGSTVIMAWADPSLRLHAERQTGHTVRMGQALAEVASDA